MERTEHANMMVLLIGSSHFLNDDSIKPIPNVEVNLTRLKATLVNPDIIGIPASNITVSVNESKGQIEKKLRALAEQTRDAKHSLLVYYSGHGMLSGEDFQLYLPTADTVKKDLEIDGLNVEVIRKYVKRSGAGVKIVILDCCHSGAIIGAMTSMSSVIQAGLKGFEGTYVMTSAAEDTPSLFPVETPEVPTYFTGKLLDILHEGLDIDDQFCSLREIYNKLESDLSESGLPRPQQSNINTADALYFSKNKKYQIRKPKDQAVDELEEEEAWAAAVAKNTFSGYEHYIEKYKNGKYNSEAFRRTESLSNQERAVGSQVRYAEHRPMNKAVKAPDMARRKKHNALFWKLTGTVCGLLLVLIIAVYTGVFGKIPSHSTIIAFAFHEPSQMFAQEGTFISKWGGDNYVPFNQISPHVIHALTAYEDPDFYDHAGIDLSMLMTGRRTITQKLAKVVVGPGSRNPLVRLVDEIKIMILAVDIERLYTKDEIIAYFLNSVSFTGPTKGIRSASRIFFAKEPDQLKISEAALLIGTLQGTARYHPVNHRDRALQIRNEVLDAMRRDEFLNVIEAEQLKKVDNQLKYGQFEHSTGLAMYFQELVRSFVKDWCRKNINPSTSEPYNMETDGLRIHTTLDPVLQYYAEESMTKQLSTLQKTIQSLKPSDTTGVWRDFSPELIKLIKTSDRWRYKKMEGETEDEIMRGFNEKVPMKIFAWNPAREKDTVMSPLDSIKYGSMVLQGSFIAMDPISGEIKAWIGGTDFRSFSRDHAGTDTKHRVGSAIQPLLFAEAVEELGYTPETPVENRAQHFPGSGMVPSKADCKGPELVAMASALARSLDCAAAYVIRQVDPERFSSFLNKINIPTRVDPYPSIALGSFDLSLMELVTAYSIFPSGGFSTEPRYVTHITDKNGAVIAKFHIEREEVITEVTAYKMTQMMQGQADRGVVKGLRTRLGFSEMGVAIGTTPDNISNWFVGYTPQIVAGAWIGYDNYFTSVAGSFGKSLFKSEKLALPAWEDFMDNIHKNKWLGFDRQAMFVEPESIRSEMVYDYFNIIDATAPPAPKHPLPEKGEYFLPDSVNKDTSGKKGFFKRLFGKKDQKE